MSEKKDSPEISSKQRRHFGWVPTKVGPPKWTTFMDPNMDPIMDPNMDPLETRAWQLQSTTGDNRDVLWDIVIRVTSKWRLFNVF